MLQPVECILIMSNNKNSPLIIVQLSDRDRFEILVSFVVDIKKNTLPQRADFPDLQLDSFACFTIINCGLQSIYNSTSSAVFLHLFEMTATSPSRLKHY